MPDNLTGTAGAGGSVAGSPPASGPGVPGPPPDGSASVSPAAPVIDWNTAPQQLRDVYQRTQAELQQTRTKLEPWERLNAQPSEIAKSHQAYSQLSAEASTLGQQLGFSNEEIAQAFQSDPIATIAYLRQKANDANGSQQPLTQAELQKLIDKQVQSKLKPFEQERELRLDHEAEGRFDSELDRHVKTSFPDGLPDSNREAISGLAWQLLIDNPDAYQALRGKGDVSNVQAAFDQAKKLFLKIVADYGEHQRKRIGQPPTPPGPVRNNGKSRSFAEIAAQLNDDSVPLDVALGR